MQLLYLSLGPVRILLELRHQDLVLGLIFPESLHLLAPFSPVPNNHFWHITGVWRFLFLLSFFHLGYLQLGGTNPDGG